MLEILGGGNSQISQISGVSYFMILISECMYFFLSFCWSNLLRLIAIKSLIIVVQISDELQLPVKKFCLDWVYEVNSLAGKDYTLFNLFSSISPSSGRTSGFFGYGYCFR